MAIRHFGGGVLLGLFLVCPSLFASDVSCGPDNTGIVCLDQATGTTLWEFFPDEAGFHLDLKTDGETLYLIDGPFWQYAQEPTTEHRAALKVTRVDPDTGLALERDYRRHPLPPPGRLLPAPREYPPTTLENGDRVLVSGRGRAIMVANEDSPQAQVIRPLEHRSSRLLTVGDIVIYSPTIDVSSQTSGPTVIALSGDTLEPLWKHDYETNVIGLSFVDGRLMVATSDVLRAIDAASGRLVWRQPLERLRDGATFEKHGNRLFVTCSYIFQECRSPRFLYCLDDRTGRIQWQHDLGDLRSGTPLIVQNGKIYTRVAPSRFVEFWWANATSRAYNRAGMQDREWTSRTVMQLANAFASKTPDEIELNLRAWHTLGDGSAVSLLRAAEEYLADDEPLSGLPRKLIDTFPPFRRPLALIDYLEEQFESQPDLRTEIGRIVDGCDPVPYWLKCETYGLMRQKPCPKFTLLPERAALIEAWQELKLRTDVAPVTRFTREAVTELRLNKRVAEFDAMLAAHEDLSSEDERLMLRLAMYAQHPTAASDWALRHLDSISPIEITLWVQRAPIEWLLDHEELYLSWLLHDDSNVRSFAMGRIPRMGDSSPALPICERFLESSIRRQGNAGDRAEIYAFKVIGQHGSRKHIRLLKRFVACESMSNDPDAKPKHAGRCERPYAVKQAAAEALTALGVRVNLPPPPPPRAPTYTDEQRETIALRTRIDQLEKDLYHACRNDQTNEAKALAREIVALYDDERPDHPYRNRNLTDAYEVLEEWDKAIEHTHRQFEDSGGAGEWRLLELYEGGSRWNDIEALIDRTRNSETRINGAFALINGDRLEKAFDVFRRELKERPNSSGAYCGLAMVHFKREEFSKADAMMEQAIALRPHVYDEPWFQYTVDYWLKRGQPEKARAWVRASIVLDSEFWRHSGLLEWAKQFPELAEEIQALDEPSG